MALPILDRLVDKSKEEPDYFLALEITETHVKSAAWIVGNGRTEVVATGSTSYWQGKDAPELITTADSSLAGLAQKLTALTQKVPSKVILGLPATWVDADNKISPDRGVYLKELTKKLELTPLGFVVTSEALAQYLKDQEGVPPSVIFVGLEDEEIEVTLIHLGKVIGRTQVARSVDLGSDLEEGLTRFLPQAIFPSRILLFNGHAALEESRQQLLSHPWQAKGSKLPFLHFPKVEILSEEETIKAVAVAGGAEAARSIGLSLAEQPPAEEAPLPQEPEEPAPTPQTPVTPSTVMAEPEKFSFVSGQDIALVTPYTPPDVPSISQVIEPPVTKPPVRPPVKIPNLKTIKIPRLTNALPQSLKIGGIIAISCLALFGLGGLLWWNFAKATVTLEVQAKVVASNNSLSIDPHATAPDPAKGILPGNFYQGTGSGQETLGTTGQKLVGTNAKGTVVIYNNTSQEINLKTGTKLTSDTGLQFTLDNVTAIASPSGTADNPTPGQTTTSITAADVGPEYNLAGGANFSVPGFTTIQVVAKNSDALTGGDKRQVQAVNSADRDKLLSQLGNDLLPQARNSLDQNVPADDQLIGSSLTSKVTSQTFDKKVGDEGTSLSLSGTVTAQALAIPKSALTAYLTSLGKNEFSDQFAVSLESSTIGLGDVKVAPDGSVKVAATLKIVATPKIDTGSVAREIAGKLPSQVDGILSHLPGFVRDEAILTPELPGPLAAFPKNPERITINVKVTNL